ncbi:MAG: glycosyltransferase family 4 protein [Azoarcus sp.]|nr:glycosyltransferase family 4 protein [Azoarcus sp.]
MSEPQLRPRRIGLISSQARSLINFRGPLIRAWVSRGVQVFALAPDFDVESRAEVAELGAVPVDFRIDRAGMNPVRDAVDLAALVRRLRTLQVDASFAYFIKPAIYGTLAARLAGVRRRFVMIEGAGYVFSEQDDTDAWRSGAMRRLVTALYRVALSGAQRVFFLNEDDVELFVSQRMVKREQVCTIGGIGVELDRFAVAPLPDGTPVFLLAARLLAHKGVGEYVEAARRIRARRPDVRFLLLGSPDLNPASVSAADLQRWHDEGVVEWQPHVADVRPWFAQASVFVLPSWYREGVPRTIQEAMAMGRAVITTDMPGCRDTVTPGETGLLVRPRDVDDLVAAMERLVDDPALVARMGAAGRLRAEACYDVHRVNARILTAMGVSGGG